MKSRKCDLKAVKEDSSPSFKPVYIPKLQIFVKMICTNLLRRRKWVGHFVAPMPSSFLAALLLLPVDRTGYNNGTYMYLSHLSFASGPFIYSLWVNFISFFVNVFVLYLFCISSPVTNKRFVLSQYLGGIKRNSTDHIVKAEAMSMSYGIKFSPELNKNTGALVG